MHLDLEKVKQLEINSADIAAGVQQSIFTAAAGHRSTNTTYRYYTFVPSEACREAVARLPWTTPEEDEHYANKTRAKVEGA